MFENLKLLDTLKQEIEGQLAWGNSSNWTNQDFISLSEAIKTKTNGTLSHVTLKRIWGKVKYESLPNTYTLNTLAEFAGYQNWREFISKNSLTTDHSCTKDEEPAHAFSKSRKKMFTGIGLGLLLVSLLIGLFSWISSDKKIVKAADYSFSSRK